MSYFFSNFQVSSFQDVKSGEDTSPPVVKQTFHEIKVKLDGSKVLEDPLFSFTMVFGIPQRIAFCLHPSVRSRSLPRMRFVKGKWPAGSPAFRWQKSISFASDFFLNLSNHLSVLGNFWGFGIRDISKYLIQWSSLGYETPKNNKWWVFGHLWARMIRFCNFPLDG